MSFGLRATLRHLREIGRTKLRDASPTPDGNALADYGGPVSDPAELSGRLESVPGVIGHGLFPPELVFEVIAGRPDGSVDRRSQR
jgi:ribose 5-phosphate isomerase A